MLYIRFDIFWSISTRNAFFYTGTKNHRNVKSLHRRIAFIYSISFSLGFYGSFEGIFAYPFENSRNVIYPGKIQSVPLSISEYSGSRTKDIKMKQFNLTNCTDQDEKAGSGQYQKGALACSYFLNPLLLIEMLPVIELGFLLKFHSTSIGLFQEFVIYPMFRD